MTTRSSAGALSPAQGATVTVQGGALRASAGADGTFFLDRVPAGAVTVRVRLFGYRPAEHAVRIVAGDTARLDVVLDPEAHLLTPVQADAPAAEIELFQSRPAIATLAMSTAAMAGIPKIGEPDVVRVVQLLPGVVARNDYNTGLNVRGGEADQNLVLLDGHPIYNPFHLGGLFSTFMDATVGGIELVTAAFPARFGGRLSSVLDVRSARETRSGVNGTADVSALGASTKLGGLVAGGRGAWSLAARRTYADAATRLFTDNIFPYHFRDFHGRAMVVLPNDVQLAVTAYVGRDVLDANLAAFDTDTAPTKAVAGQWAFDWGNRVFGLTLSREVTRPRIPLLGVRLGERATLEQRVSTSAFSTELNLGEGAFTQRNSVRDMRLAGSVTVHASAHEPSLGYEVATHRVRYASGSSQTATDEFDIVQRPTATAAWLDDLWRVSPRWLVQGGIRAEALSTRDWTALSPRLSVKFFAAPDLAFTVGGGRVTQWLHSLAGDAALRYFDIWVASDAFIPVAKAWHGVAGAERRFGAAASLRLEAYVKRYERVMEANPSEDPLLRGDEFFPAEGISYGVDLLARRAPPAGNARGWGGWLAYSYGVSGRRRDGVTWFPGHDRRHDVDLVATWRLARYRLGVRFGWASGTPYTPIVGQIARRVYDPSRDRWGTGDPALYAESLGGERNSARFPASHRLDLDASRQFAVRGAIVAPYLSVANAYNARNVFVYLYNYSTDLPTRRAISQFPVLPSLGVRVEF